MSLTLIIILLSIAAIVLGFWVFGVSMRETLRKIENESEDAYWLLEDYEKYIENLEKEEEAEKVNDGN